MGGSGGFDDCIRQSPRGLMSDLSDVEFNKRMLKGIALSVLTGSIGGWSYLLGIAAADVSLLTSPGDALFLLAASAVVGGLLAFVCFPAPAGFFMRGGTMSLALLRVALPTIVVCFFAGSLMRLAPSLETAIFGPFACMVVFGVSALIYRPGVPPPPHLCVSCGYDRTGLLASRCPECGRSPSDTRE